MAAGKSSGLQAAVGLNIAQEYGGFGASALLFSRVFGEVGVTDAALAVYFALSAVTAEPAGRMSGFANASWAAADSPSRIGVR